MGGYGHIHLTFQASSQSATIQHDCPTDLGSAYTETRRSGNVTGQFALATRTAYFKTISNATSAPVHIPASIPSHVGHYTYGNNCGSSNRCVTQLFMGVSTPQGAISAYQYPLTHIGTVEFDISDSTLPSTFVRHEVFGRAATKVLVPRSSTPQPLQRVAISMPFSPFLTGQGTFAGSGNASVTASNGCRETDRGGSFSGNFQAHLDGWGLQTFSGSNTADAQRRAPVP